MSLHARRATRLAVGIFDFLRSKSTPPAGGGPAVDKKVAGPAKVAADKRAQTYDRLEALQALAEMKSVDAARALLKRFTFSIDPSITDQEEKDIAYQGVIAAGPDVVPVILEFCAKAEVLTWPLKVLRELLEDDDYRKQVLVLLERFDTEYTRNVEPKLQTILALEDVVNDDVRAAVEPFLDDVNETIRFHAVETIFRQGSAASVPAIAKMLAAEESVRVKNKVAEGLVQKGWPVPADQRDAVREALRDTADYGIDGGGNVTKR
jgi:hypothetical protein